MIARMSNMRTELGAHLDPLADKLLVVSSFIALGIMGLVPRPLMIIVIMRDIVILGGYVTAAVVTASPMEMKPSLWGKATTFSQISRCRRAGAAGRRDRDRRRRCRR